MNYKIRAYTSSDFPVVESWWKDANEIPPSITMLPESSTFILELDNIPTFCLSVYLTNCKEYAYLGNFVSNKKIKNKFRKQASQKLMDYTLCFAGELGYKQVICMSHVDKLKNRYNEMGFHTTLTNVQTFVRKTG